MAEMSDVGTNCRLPERVEYVDCVRDHRHVRVLADKVEYLFQANRPL